MSRELQAQVVAIAQSGPRLGVGASGGRDDGRRLSLRKHMRCVNGSALEAMHLAMDLVVDLTVDLHAHACVRLLCRGRGCGCGVLCC